MPIGVDEMIGALPDAIAWAIMQAAKAVSGQALETFVDYGFEPLLEVTNPASSPEAMTAWSDIRTVAMALLPLALVGSFIAWPFSLEKEDVSLWQLVLRLVGILLLIGISKPLWGFAVDATNAVTLAISPDSFKITFSQDALDVGGNLLDFVMYPTAAGLLLLSFLVSSMLLVLRWVLIWLAFLGTPLFAVMLYPKWGPFKSINKYGATFIRMGVYALLAGPVIALILRVYAVIMGGGLITGQSDIAGTLHEFGVSIAFIVLLPIVLFIAIYKIVAWAGQPIGIGQAFSSVTAALAAAAGAFAGGALGGVGGASAGGSATSAGGGGGAGAGAGVGGGSAGAGGSGAATDPSADTGASMVDAGVDNSIDEETWQAADEAVEDGINTGSVHGAASKGASLAKSIKGAPKKAATKGAKAAGSARDIPSSKLKNQREAAADHMEQVEEAKANQDMLDIGGDMGEGQTIGDDPEFDVSAAKERGIFDPHEALDEDPPPMPADDAGTVTPDADGTIEYVTAESGGEVTETTNIHSDLKPREEAKQAHHLSKARGHAKTAEQLKAAQAGGRMAGSITGKTIKSQKAMMKAGGAAMAGAVTGHPYHGWRVGKSMGRKSYMGGAKDWLISPNQTQAGTETDVPDATTTTPASTGRASNDQVDSVDTNYYTYR